MQKFLNGKKLNFLLPTTSAIQFPKDLTFKLVLHGFTRNENQSKQLSSNICEAKIQENINM